MGHYIATARTSYFKPRDEEKFKEWAETIPESEVVVRHHGQEGTLYAFLLGNTGDSGTLPCLRWDEELDDSVEFDFCEEVQQHVADGWVVTVMEVGAEKYRYLVGHAAVITPDTIESMNLHQFVDQTLKALGSPKHAE